MHKLTENLNDKITNLRCQLQSCEQKISDTLNGNGSEPQISSTITSILDKHLCEEKLQEFCDAKSKWENEMYSHIALVLNEKKKRIRHLTELLESKYALGVIESAERKVKTRAQGHGGRKLSSDDNSEEEIERYETDDEEPAAQHEDVPTPPKLKHTVSSLLEIDDMPTTSFLPKRMKKPDDVTTQRFIENTEMVAAETAVLSPEPKPEEKCVTQFTLASQELLNNM